MSYASGLGLVRAEPGKEAKFQITGLDTFGNARKEASAKPDPFQGVMSGPCPKARPAASRRHPVPCLACASLALLPP